MGGIREHDFPYLFHAKKGVQDELFLGPITGRAYQQQFFWQL